VNREVSQTVGQALRSLGATEDVLRRGHVRLGLLARQGRLAGDDARGFANLRLAYDGCNASVIAALRDAGVPSSVYNVTYPVPPLPLHYQQAPDFVTQAQTWIASAMQDEGLSVAITDKSKPLDAPQYHQILQRLRKQDRIRVLIESMPDTGDQVSTLVRLAALYDIYLDYRLREEGIGEGPGFLATIPPHVQDAAVRFGPVVMGVAGILLNDWLTGNKGKGHRPLSKLAEAIEAAEAGG